MSKKIFITGGAGYIGTTLTIEKGFDKEFIYRKGTSQSIKISRIELAAH